MSLVEALDVAPGEIPLVANVNRPSAPGRVAGDAATVYPAADNRDIEERGGLARRHSVRSARSLASLASEG